MRLARFAPILALTLALGIAACDEGNIVIPDEEPQALAPEGLTSAEMGQDGPVGGTAALLKPTDPGTT